MKKADAEKLLLKDVIVKFYLRPVSAARGYSPGFPGRWQNARYTLVECGPADAGAIITRPAKRYKRNPDPHAIFHNGVVEDYQDTLLVPYAHIVREADPLSWDEPSMLPPDPPTPAGGDPAGVPALPPDSPQDRPPMAAAMPLPTMP